MKRNPYRIRKPDLPLVLARLNLAAFCVAIGTDKIVEGDLQENIAALVRLAKKQTFRDGKKHVIGVPKKED